MPQPWPLNGKTGEKGSMFHTVEMKQPQTITEPFLFEGRKGQMHTAFPFGVRK